jgi:hypothetical protein
VHVDRRFADPVRFKESLGGSFYARGGAAGGIVDHRPYCSGDCLGGGCGNAEADELLVDGQSARR